MVSLPTFSLQPTSDSVYAVSDITPMMMKDYILKIASKNKLAGLPEHAYNVSYLILDTSFLL